MGFFSSIGAKLGAVASVVNPVAAIANFGQFGLDQIAANQQRQFEKGLANQQWDLAQQNMQMQKEFAQNGIRWRVSDAEAAGLSPLAALGAQTSGFSPVGMNYFPSSDPESRPYANMGQNIQRAIQSMETPHERMMNLITEEKARVDLDFAKLQYVAALKSVNGSTQQPGTPSSFQYMKNPDGSLSLEPSLEWSQANSGNLFTPLIWWAKNKLLPSIMGQSTMRLPSEIQVGPRNYKSLYGSGRYFTGPGMNDLYEVQTSGGN